MQEPLPDTLQEGYVWGYDRSAPVAPLNERGIVSPDAPNGFQSGVRSPTMEQWVCPTCFEDFKERFRWTTDPADVENA
jgi:hypothetical protein